MVVQTAEKQVKEEKTANEFLHLNSTSDACERDEAVPYEKKYYALLHRCETIKQSNERLVNRIYHVKKLLKRKRKERKFLMKRLDDIGDDYKSVSISLFSEVYGDPTVSSCPQNDQPQSSQLHQQPNAAQQQPKLEVGS